MLKIGVTGGIGSGKTTVCQLFELHGMPVFYSDQVSKHILATDSDVRKAVVARVGANSYTADGPDRAFLASVVFNDKAALEFLNGLLHPKVGLAFAEWCTKQNSAYVLKEAAILFEAGAQKGLDAVIVVSAPDEVRIERVAQRDGVSREAVLKRMAKQMPQNEKVALADHIVENDGSRSLIEQVNKLHAEFIGSSNAL